MSPELPLPEDLWPLVHRRSGGSSWPPEDRRDAERFVERARLDKLLPLLLAQHDLPHVVSAALEEIRALGRIERVRAAAFDHMIDRLPELVEDDFILLKGSDYRTRLYPETWLRPMQDIDVLVPIERIRTISRRLEAKGFERLSATNPAARLDSYHEIRFSIENRLVELHHSLVLRLRHRIDYDAIWDRRVPTGKPHTFRLSHDDAILCHCIGLGKDQLRSPLIHILDLWLMARQKIEAIQTIRRRAIEWEASHMLYASIRHTANCFPDFLAGEGHRIATTFLPPLRRRVLSRVLVPPPEEVRTSDLKYRTVQLWRKFWLIDRLSRRMRFLLYQPYASLIGLLRGRRGSR